MWQVATFTWSKTKQVGYLLSITQKEDFPHSLRSFADHLKVEVGTFVPTLQLSTAEGNLTAAVKADPIPVEDPDKGSGYRSLLPSCRARYIYNGFNIGDSLFSMKIDCSVEKRWGNIFGYTQDPLTFDFKLTPIQGVTVIGLAYSKFIGPVTPGDPFNRFLVLLKQVIQVHSLPAILDVKFTFQVNSSASFDKAKTYNWQMYTDLTTSWRQLVQSFAEGPEEFNSCQSSDLAVSIADDQEFEMVYPETIIQDFQTK